ncbi:hypothetical protein DM860_013213 [Cuscuta australis]|uniref:RNase H type-1 domain-containing protein n=1 Tax=Cuscuta australis TaxID=267555 RepID=A0A328DRG2_9ASTE|nr:hypothetical protein DM860_013213 [Cuscuta australis]
MVATWNALGRTNHLPSTLGLADWMEARNEAVLEHKVPLPETVVSWARESVRDGARRSSQGGRTEVRHNSLGSGQDVFRCFVDAAIFPSSGLVSFGSVILNGVGSFHAIVNGWIQCVCEPVLAEAMACREALSWVKENGIRDVELLSDCSSIVEALRDGSF